MSTKLATERAALYTTECSAVLFTFPAAHCAAVVASVCATK
jgi:hypothetical protein